MAHRYLAPLADCLFLMLPPGLAKRGDTEYDLLDLQFDAESDTQFRLIELIRRRGPLRGQQIDRAFPKRNWRPAAAALVKRRVLSRRAVLQPPSVRPKAIRTARLLIPPAQVPLAQFRLRHSPRIAGLLDYLFGLYPGQPALPDLLDLTGLAEADLRPLVEARWISLTEPEPVISPVYPNDIMEKWILEHQATHPEAAAVVRSLVRAGGAVPARQLPVADAQLLALLDQHDLLRHSVNPPRVILHLKGPQVAAQALILRKPSKRAAVLAYLAGHPEPAPVSQVYAETGATAAQLKELAGLDLIDLSSEEMLRDPLAGRVFVAAEPPPLTLDQWAAWEAIEAAFTFSTQAAFSHPPFLLHGVTGSGKTEIYLRAIARALAIKRRAILLVPEIALTPQAIQRVASRFPGRVAVIHSELTPGERYDTWRRCRSGAVDVVVGARSALFAPLPDIGLIVLDEEHDEAYQQDPPSAPYYHAREVAVEYARRLNAICAFGSATPDIVSYARARRGDYRLLELPQRILAHGDYIAQVSRELKRPTVFQPIPAHQSGSSVDRVSAQYAELPSVSIVDMRNELRAGNRSIFSRALQAALAEVLGREEQAILFLNRRGRSTYVFCRDCGHVLACGRCDLPLTYHGSDLNLRCHHCGAARRQPAVCPQCGGRRIKFFGAGTELVEHEIKAMFPQARTLRWDRDTTRFKGAHEVILTDFRERRADVLIGTQMIAKGLDLPLVTLVGVVSADVGLNLPDYRAAECAFQVLTQVAGRAGRSVLGGRVVVQSYQPDHYAVQAAARHDYAGFFESEMEKRRKLGYPPFGRLVRLTYRHLSPERAESEARSAAATLHHRLSSAEARSTAVIGPAPCFFERIAGDYRWQLVLRGPNPADLIRGLTFKDWRVEVEPMSLL
jgi:primosomal protein N' (replication factor Y)